MLYNFCLCIVGLLYTEPIEPPPFILSYALPFSLPYIPSKISMPYNIDTISHPLVFEDEVIICLLPLIAVVNCLNRVANT